MAKKSIILVLVEGRDEVKVLEAPLSKIFNSDNLQMKITEGDIFLHDDVNHSNIMVKIDEHIKQKLKEKNLSIKSVSKVMHIIDIDGCFLDEKLILEDVELENSPHHSMQNIVTRDRTATINNLKKKVSFIKKFKNCTNLGVKDYKLIFLSLNLENAFGYAYNNRKNENLRLFRKKII